MLGVIHRTVLGDGPPQFRKYFHLDAGHVSGISTRHADNKHSKQLHDPRSASSLDVMKRSALGLIAVYNLLPEDAVTCTSVSDFQTCIQDIVKLRALAGYSDWKETLSPRVQLWRHPLL